MVLCRSENVRLLDSVNYREAYGMYACNGILFNHESERRGASFVTRKITLGVGNIIKSNQACLYMGNIDAERNWSHAEDYLEMQWLMLHLYMKAWI